MRTVFFLMVFVVLAGCSEESTPEPNAATCEPSSINKALSEIRSETNRKAFIEDCKSFQKAKKMGEWKFKPSPKDDF